MATASLFLLLLLCIATLSLANVNIDCGTSTSSLDNNGISWVGDQGFITSGLSTTVSSTTLEKSHTTLRYFPTGESNCYTKIPVTRTGKVLVRTFFYYGNYDGKFLYPTFNVVYDGKHQSTITISSASLAYYSDVIFIPTSGEISVCFVRTSSSSNPFVSSIEVADLDSGMYSELGPNEGFFIHERIDYGATQGIRSDIYGRIWFPAPLTVWLNGPISTASIIDTSGSSNKPPVSVLRNCWTYDYLSLVDPRLPFQPIPAYFVMYFSEPLSFGVRSFNIYIGGKQINKVPVTPVYGKTTQVVVRDVMVSSSTRLELFSTASSVFYPPIINALELYMISKATSGSGGSGGGGSGGGGSGPPAPGGSPKVIQYKDSTAPIIIGVVVSFVCVFIVITIVLCYCKDKTEPLTKPPNGSTVQPLNGSTVQLSSGSTVQPPVGHIPTATNTGTGQSAVNDTNRSPAYDELSTLEIDNLLIVNHSYVVGSR